jgi:hypothetical protein
MTVVDFAPDLRPEQAGSDALLAADVPWRLRDLTRTTRTLLFGAVVVIAGWVGASGTPLISRQLAWAAVSVTGVSIAGLGMVSWLLGGLRVIHQVSEEALAPLQAEYVAPGPDADVPAPSPVGSMEAVSSALLVSAPRMTRFHAPSCLLVRGKPTRVLRADGSGELRPCGVCQS